MKRKPGEQAPADQVQIPEDQLRAERIAEARRLNENRNQEQLDRRNAIADEADEARDEELADIDDQGRIVERGRGAEDVEAAAAEEERQAQAERERIAAGGEPEGGRAQGEDDPDSRVTNGVRYYRLIVNGKEKWLTLQQLRETSSKVDAADEYLQQAAESARRAVALSSRKDAESEESDTELEEVINKALLGDPESVKKLAQHLKASPSRVTPDVMQAVDERLTFREAVNWFEGEYEAELNDPRLKEMIVREDVRLRDANPDWGYKKRLKAAGDAVRKWRNDLIGSTGASQGGSQGAAQGAGGRNEKLLRKQRMSQVAGAGGRQGGAEDEDAEEPVSEQIARMAAGRHQQRAIKH